MELRQWAPENFQIGVMMTDSGLAFIASERWILAAAIALLWIGLSYFWLRKPVVDSKAGILVVYASQTGHAGELASSTHQRIIASGHGASLINIAELTAPLLAEARRILFIISTTGHGDAPDPARTFERKLMARKISLSHVETAVLALGDKGYPDFCSFGARVDFWLKQCGAEPLSSMIEVDDLSPDDLAKWDQLLNNYGYLSDAIAPASSLVKWSVIERELVANGDVDGEKSSHGSGHSGSRSDGLYRLRLKREDHIDIEWQIGDLFELTTSDGHKRDYSIANRDNSQGLELFVRRISLTDGDTGRGSGLLTGADPAQTEILGRIRTYDQFRPTQAEGPLLAVAAGSGWAGIRPHVIEAYENKRDVWLIFGERGHDEDEPLLAEMRAWKEAGHLAWLDLALSRSSSPSAGDEQSAKGPRYVQDVIAAHEKSVAQFLSANGSVVLCGGLAMGEGFIGAMGKCLGEEWIEKARSDNRWRQELY